MKSLIYGTLTIILAPRIQDWGEVGGSLDYPLEVPYIHQIIIIRFNEQMGRNTFKCKLQSIFAIFNIYF